MHTLVIASIPQKNTCLNKSFSVALGLNIFIYIPIKPSVKSAIILLVASNSNFFFLCFSQRRFIPKVNRNKIISLLWQILHILRKELNP